MDISVIIFDSISVKIRKVSAIHELTAVKNDEVMWININGLNDTDSIKQMEKMFAIHPLTIEDVLNTKQQPKVETFDNYRFISFKSIQLNEAFKQVHVNDKRLFDLNSGKKGNKVEHEERFCIDQISIIIMDNLIITFQEIPGEPYDGIRKRILDNIGRVRTMGTDYITYSLIDAVVDEYNVILSQMEDDIEIYEDRAAKTSDDTFISAIQDAKKDLFLIKRAMLPLRTNLVLISRQNIPLFRDQLKPFLQDLQENLLNALESVESYRDWLSNIMEVNLSVLSYQTNKVMKILAIVSSIFIPLTFIAGVYGMNFQHMPELAMQWAYPVVLCGMGFIALMMILFFRKRHWF
ncbi:MAG: magnesium/cobalt transporter CorA [Treponema sp.]|nr:magnesium/cobalt transporter CorA [Treponema sp.]